MNLENSYSSFDGSSDEQEKRPPKRGSDGKKSLTPVLDNFSRDLVELALEDKLDQIINKLGA